jgi:hypothetical protein
VLAREAIILCGTARLIWAQLEYSLHYTWNLLDDCRSYIQDEKDYLLICKSVRKIARLTLICLRKDKLSAADVFDCVGGNDCTDVRDKIYGLLGVIPNAGLLCPEPDYKLSEEEVHWSAFDALATKSHNLDFLSLVLNSANCLQDYAAMLRENIKDLSWKG